MTGTALGPAALVALGSAAGGVARWLAASAVQRVAGGAFPAGTLAVNVTGSFVVGFLAVRLGGDPAQAGARLLLMTGFCGGYTTFSTFALEALVLAQQGRPGRAALYAAASVAGAVAGAALGWMAGRRGA